MVSLMDIVPHEDAEKEGKAVAVGAAEAEIDEVAEGDAGVRIPGAAVKMPMTPPHPIQLLTRHSRVLTPATKPPPMGTKKACSCMYDDPLS